MSRQKDSIETILLKERMTKLFVKAVDISSVKARPKEWEIRLGIGGKNPKGIVWCAYRRGVRTMSFTTLRSKVKMAVDGGYITERMAYQIIKELSITAQDEHAIDCRNFFVSDITKTVKLLEQQVQAYLKSLPEKNLLPDLLKPLNKYVP
ncbi:hypothetical protein [Methylotenera sp.]|uniref:hypothetical protein n=1 Tax=Methylotenera sp. TaxID=2051956 RepID=UPI002ED7F0FB